MGRAGSGWGQPDPTRGGATRMAGSRACAYTYYSTRTLI